MKKILLIIILIGEIMADKNNNSLQKKEQKIIKDVCISVGCGVLRDKPKIKPNPGNHHDPRFNQIPKRKIKIRRV